VDTKENMVVTIEAGRIFEQCPVTETLEFYPLFQISAGSIDISSIVVMGDDQPLIEGTDYQIVSDSNGIHEWDSTGWSEDFCGAHKWDATIKIVFEPGVLDLFDVVSYCYSLDDAYALKIHRDYNGFEKYYRLCDAISGVLVNDVYSDSTEIVVDGTMKLATYSDPGYIWIGNELIEYRNCVEDTNVSDRFILTSLARGKNSTVVIPEYFSGEKVFDASSSQEINRGFGSYDFVNSVLVGDMTENNKLFLNSCVGTIHEPQCSAPELGE
jgi:hypothetical protein